MRQVFQLLLQLVNLVRDKQIDILQTACQLISSFPPLPRFVIAIVLSFPCFSSDLDRSIGRSVGVFVSNLNFLSHRVQVQVNHSDRISYFHWKENK